MCITHQFIVIHISSQFWIHQKGSGRLYSSAGSITAKPPSSFVACMHWKQCRNTVSTFEVKYICVLKLWMLLTKNSTKHICPSSIFIMHWKHRRPFSSILIETFWDTAIALMVFFKCSKRYLRQERIKFLIVPIYLRGENLDDSYRNAVLTLQSKNSIMSLVFSTWNWKRKI